MEHTSTNSIQLRRPSLELLPSYLGSIAEMRARGERIWEGWVPGDAESPAAFIERISARAEQNPRAGAVPVSIYWATSAGVVVGRVALRHHLTPSLEQCGGHISYEVRPSRRRQGVATEMLRLALELPRARALGRVLLTCSPGNIASNKTIAANGGVLTRTAFASAPGRQTNYYWIELRAPA